MSWELRGLGAFATVHNVTILVWVLASVWDLLELGAARGMGGYRALPTTTWTEL